MYEVCERLKFEKSDRAALCIALLVSDEKQSRLANLLWARDVWRSFSNVFSVGDVQVPKAGVLSEALPGCSRDIVSKCTEPSISKRRMSAARPWLLSRVCSVSLQSRTVEF